MCNWRNSEKKEGFLSIFLFLWVHRTKKKWNKNRNNGTSSSTLQLVMLSFVYVIHLQHNWHSFASLYSLMWTWPSLCKQLFSRVDAWKHVFYSVRSWKPQYKITGSTMGTLHVLRSFAASSATHASAFTTAVGVLFARYTEQQQVSGIAAVARGVRGYFAVGHGCLTMAAWSLY